MIDLDDVVSCVAAGIYGDDRMSPRERDGALASLSALVEEVKRLREDAVVARSVETTLTVEVERLRTNAAARERFLRREGNLLRAAERDRDDLRDRLRVTAQILIAAVAADGPMNAEDAARKAVAEVERLREQRHDDGKGRRVDAYLAGALDERAAVVAWLREEAEPSPQSFTVRGKEWAKRIDDIADCIERGEHRREEER